MLDAIGDARASDRRARMVRVAHLPRAWQERAISYR